MIYVIGDSNTYYLSCNKEVILRMINGTGPVQDNLYISVNDKDFTLLYHSGLPAYKVSHDYLVKRFNDFSINSKTPIFFQFGAIDIRVHLYKYKNTKDVVKKYVEGCISFCEPYGLKPIFIQPFACPEHIENNLEFEEALRLECKRLNLPAPIEIIGSLIERDYHSEPEDETCHLSIKNNYRLLELLVEYSDIIF